MEKILITGSDGYLGATILSHLNNEGRYDVHKLKGRLEHITINSLDYDLVIHTAGALRNRIGQHQNTNVSGTKTLIDGLKKKTKIVYISSKSIYGTKTSGKVTELEVPKPDDDYGISKYDGELAIKFSGHPYIVLRSSTLYGLGQDNFGPSSISKIFKRLINNQPIELHLPDRMHDYLFVKDLAWAISRIIRQEKAWNECFNISGKTESLTELILYMKESVSRYFQNPIEMVSVYKGTPNFFLLDTSRIETLLGNSFYAEKEKVIDEMISYAFP